METPESPTGPVLVEPVESLEPVFTAPPVVAIVVTHDAGPSLEAVVASLAGQDYPSLSVLVLDSGSAEDTTARIAAVMPHAYVRRLPVADDFPAAANDALGTVEGATFLLFCHDDVVLDPVAVRVMVEEAYRSNAGIVGPKLVAYDNPDVLLEVGMTIDHYGVPFSGIEPNEVDQEQHDAVRDVFFVSHAAMLVRADLFSELGGFDGATAPGSDDLDLCWRARLAGARVLVAPDARVQHRGDSARDERVIAGTAAEVTKASTRGRVRVLMKAYSGLALCWVLPTAFFLDMVDAIGLAFTRQRGRARGLVTGWFANIRSLGDIRRARKRAQSLRRVDDGDVRDLMVRGSARVRTLVTHRFRAPDRFDHVTARTRRAVDRAGGRLRHPASIGAVVVALIVLFGSRDVLFAHAGEVGSLRGWPGVSDLFRTFWSPWQRTGLGVDAPATPALALMGTFSAVLLGHIGLARTLVVAGALPLGAIGVYRVTRPFARSRAAGLAAAIAYTVNPLPRNAIAQGRLGSLVLYALAPFIAGALLRGAGPTDDAPRLAESFRRQRAFIAAIALAAIATAFFPAALLFAPLVAVAFLVAVPLVGDARFAVRTSVVALATLVGAAVVLVPWTFVWFRGDGAALGLVGREPIALSAVLRFNTGPAGAGWAPWGLLVAAALPLFMATGSRLAWAGRAWMLVAASYTLAWLPARLDASIARPETEGVLVGAALGLALAVGLGVAAFTDDLRRFLFGWRQFAAVAGALGLLLPVIGLAADSVGGRWRVPTRDWDQSITWMRNDHRHGDFRVLWMGDPEVLPVGARDVAHTSYGFSQNGPGDVRDAFTPPRGDGEDVMDSAIELLSNRQTTRFGHLVAPMGVRYIALVGRGAPSAGVTRAYDGRLQASLADQLDLAVVQAEPGMLLYENRSFAPVRAVVPPRVDLQAPSGDPTAAAMRTELDGAAAVNGPLDASRVTRAGSFLFGDAYDARWKLSKGNQSLAHQRALGWSNAYAGVTPGTYSLHFDGGVSRPLWLTLESIVCLALFTGWYVLRRREKLRRPHRRPST